MKTNEMAPYIRKTVEEIDGDILKLNQDLQELQNTRRSLVALYGGDTEMPEPVFGVGMAATRAVKAGKKKLPTIDMEFVRRTVLRDEVGHPVRPAAQLSVASSLDKPDTLAAAMKSLVKKLPQPFTAVQITEALNADVDFAKLLAAASPATMHGNLAYWSKTGKLQKSGDGAAATYKNVSF